MCKAFDNSDYIGLGSRKKQYLLFYVSIDTIQRIVQKLGVFYDE